MPDDPFREIVEIKGKLRLHSALHNITLGVLSVLSAGFFIAFIFLIIDYFNFTSDKREKFQESREERILINFRLDNIELLLNEYSSDTTRHFR